MLIAQLSDPHVRPDGVLYKGVVDSNALFAAAIAQVNALDPRPDLVLLSGDLVDEGDPAEYAMLRRLLRGLKRPLRVIPGNHDSRTAFAEAFAEHSYLPRSGPMNYVADDCGPVRLVALDVTVPGLHHGVIDDVGAQWLEEALAAAPERPTVLMMHQPPFACGIPYLDAYLCREGDRLAAIVSRHPQVERIVCGHVHRHMQLRFAGTILCTAPSTATAIALRLKPDAEPASFEEPPAMLLHHWQPAIGLITHFLPIGAFAGPYPFA
ncbi:Calcineurin-like phosphoesterase [Enhydrobacter aerosaccus]|uniref:Calcineurin-like phosphoesterase n=1 Tax=Enhydrobacter aerosaccus TaxID=225324 RepID=A0A1T4T9P0_9HYPH|nr:phosphodiesterase [Enhydrobacter aerosaccus]SKA37156.1 Calcineurin-like phosphoesterase [Enhydrobacter aerosaccus]